MYYSITPDILVAPFPIKYTYMDKNSRGEQLEVPYHLVGSVHWVQVSKIFKTALYLSTWEKPVRVLK